MPTYYNPNPFVVTDPNRGLTVAPGSTYSGLYYFPGSGMELISRDPFWDPIAKSEILSGTAGSTAQVSDLESADYLTFCPSDEVKIYFNDLSVTPLHTQKCVTVQVSRRVSVVVVEFMSDGNCEIHGVKSTFEFE